MSKQRISTTPPPLLLAPLGEEGFELCKCKTDVKCCPPRLGEEEKFSFYTALNSFKRPFFYLFTLLKNIRLMSYTRLSLKNCVKSQLKLFLISGNQTFIFIDSKVAILRSILQVYHQQETKHSIPFNVPFCCQKFKLAAGVTAEPLQT